MKELKRPRLRMIQTNILYLNKIISHKIKKKSPMIDGILIKVKKNITMRCVMKKHHKHISVVNDKNFNIENEKKMSRRNLFFSLFFTLDCHYLLIMFWVLTTLTQTMLFNDKIRTHLCISWVTKMLVYRSNYISSVIVIWALTHNA